MVKNLVIDICKQFDLNVSYASDLEKVSSVLKRNCKKEFQDYLRSKYIVRDYNPLYDTLKIKNFWFTDELEREFKRVCVNSSEDAFNSAAFKRIGYSLNMGYAYNDIYSSVISYFDAEVFSADIVDLNELDR